MDNHQKQKPLVNGGWVLYPFRSLTNYKAMHKERARKMGVLEQFMAARTLTRARKIVFPK